MYCLKFHVALRAASGPLASVCGEPFKPAFHMTGVALDRSGIGMRSGTGNRLLRSPTFQHHQVQSECGDIAVSGRGRRNKERPRGVEVSEESEHPSIRY